ncbi:MAG: 2-amino-4-hydroxy-6-hydroxymethyldihydropteridine diphosphokinase [bacterium]|nr:2-amino-4-hydroxy-6-hydroxymethyldihydropteridine diphosphokinase [bacterium]
MSKVYISLGSNLGDRQKNIEEAIKLISHQPLIKINKISPVYETEPVGFSEQGWFLNLAMELETTLLPQKLLAVLQEIEAKLSKKLERKWGPRTIDLDILLYADIILDLPDLQIPHKLMQTRAFVLIPLAQIAPNIKHPVLNKTIQELLRIKGFYEEVRKLKIMN